jgi:hypothetical protein
MMGMLLAFAPFIGFALIAGVIGATQGLICAAVISAAMLVRDWVSPERTVKILEIGTAILFTGLSIYALLAGARSSIVGVRLCVDGGLFLIVLVSIALRRPFTLQYAREQTAPEIWNRPEFLHANYMISAAWGVAFAVMVAADIVMVFVPNVPVGFGFGATVLALVGAIRFTSWYPQRLRARLAEQS